MTNREWLMRELAAMNDERLAHVLMGGLDLRLSSLVCDDCMRRNGGCPRPGEDEDCGEEGSEAAWLAMEHEKEAM